jgi:activator of HSP90 ATPase
VRTAGGAPLAKSAWNVKDTWEEVDVTSWAVERIAELLMGTPLPLYDGDLRLRIYDVRRVVGHAQVVIFQRKVRSIFDLEAMELSWVAEDGGEGRFKGNATLRGFANSADATDLEISTSFVTKTETHEAVKTFLRNEGGARAQLAQVLADFEREFTQLTGDGVALARSFEKSGRLRDPDADANAPEVREARLAAAKRQAFQDDMRISNPKLKVTM